MSIAVIYVPPDRIDVVTAETLDCCTAAGYAVADVADCDWPSTLINLADRAAGVIVLAGLHHIDQGHVLRRLHRRPPNRPYTNDRVREIIEGDGVAPTGLDPATVAAIRRIRRRLQGDHF
jgi:hypothetical protein